MQTTTTNLFGNVSIKETAKKTSDKKVIAAPLLDDKIKRFNALKDEIEAATGQLKMLEGDIKSVGRDLYMKAYKADKMKPESFKIQDQSGSACMLIVMDKYTIVDETKAAILQNFEGLLDEKLSFKINADLVEKYGNVLSDLICNSPDIDEADKYQLIQGEKQFGVRKGAIDRLLQYDSPETIFELINPIVALKK